MSTGIVFKQSYKSANRPTTPMLNGKHLIYIATRKGAIRNPDCAFGLWGKITANGLPENINDLHTAHRVVVDASKQHTIYRAILSVDKDTAARHDLYEREPWQRLVTQKIAVLAKEMDINPTDFRWAASMHYAKNHPHVHIVYWDSSARVRQEHVPKERFEIIAEHVRAVFGREIYREELAEHRAEVGKIVKQARTELNAMCREVNLTDALNLDHISAVKLDELGASLYRLTLALPSSGALKYAYLPPACKQKTDELLDEVFQISDFRQLGNRYAKLTKEIGGFYGNTEQSLEHHLKKGKEKLYRDMGNTVLSVLKEYRDSFAQELPESEAQLQAVVQHNALAILRKSDGYAELAKLFPQRRTPLAVTLAKDAFREKKNEVVKSIQDDLRVRKAVDGYLKGSAKDLPDKEEKKALWRKGYGTVYRVIDHLVMQQLQEDAEYPQQQKSDMAFSLLLRLFKEGSQGTNQMQSQRDLLRHRELSKAALRDLQKQREQEGNWTNEP